MLTFAAGVLVAVGLALSIPTQIVCTQNAVIAGRMTIGIRLAL